MMKKLLQFLYWKVCFPKNINLFPLKLSVVSGPFQGMSYVAWSQGSSLSPKILGTYEKELHTVVESIKQQSFDRIIDVGAAEGYYTVGLGLSSKKQTTIFAFEMEEKGRRLMQQLADLNKVSNIQILGKCEPSDLLEVLDPLEKCLIICDVEGFEVDLIDPQFIPNPKKTWILVEAHDYLQHGITNLLRSRFQSTHKIQEIASTNRTWQDFPEKSWFAHILPPTFISRAMNEGRRPMNWLWMEPLE